LIVRYLEISEILLMDTRAKRGGAWAIRGGKIYGPGLGIASAYLNLVSLKIPGVISQNKARFCIQPTLHLSSERCLELFQLLLREHTD